jgi:gag-polypeptide of LTR copia-type
MTYICYRKDHPFLQVMSLMAEASGSARVGANEVPRLTAASNYDAWETCMRAFLDGQGWLDVVETPVATGTVMERARSAGRPILTEKDVSNATLMVFGGGASNPTPNEDKEDDNGQLRAKLVKRSKQAFAVLLNAIDDTLLALVKDCMQGDANGLWERLRQHHLLTAQPAGVTADLRAKLIRVKLERKADGEYEDVKSLVARMKGWMATLRQMKEPVHDGDVIHHFLRAVRKLEQSSVQFSVQHTLARFARFSVHRQNPRRGGSVFHGKRRWRRQRQRRQQRH